MKINRYPLFALVISLLALCACKHEKPYTITGTLDLPAQIPYGDTIIDVPSFNDTWVYLLDFDNQLLDSALIADNAFHFEGTVDNRQPYYVQFVSQLGSTLLVIEPGDIEVFINPDITVSGTPSNEAMADLDAALEDLNAETYDYLAQLTDSMRAEGSEEVPEDLQMQIAEQFRTKMNHILDSTYHANRNNMAAAYAAIMRNIDVQSADEFEEAMSKYPKSIRENELVQINLRSLRQYEQTMEDDSLVFDPSILGVEDLEQYAPLVPLCLVSPSSPFV